MRWPELGWILSTAPIAIAASASCSAPGVIPSTATTSASDASTSAVSTRSSIAPSIDASSIDPRCAGVPLPGDTLAVRCLQDGPDRGWAVILVPPTERTKANASVSFVAWADLVMNIRIPSPCVATSIGAPELVDIDGDGQSELLVDVDRQHLLRFREGTIAEVERPAGTIVRFADLDGDGRLDPIYVHDLGVVRGCRGPERLTFEQPAHTRPDGRVVLDDAETRKALRALCPRRTVPTGDAILEVRAVRCARIHGHGERALTEALIRACPARGVGAACDDPCASFDALLTAAMHTPWATIPAKPAP